MATGLKYFIGNWKMFGVKSSFKIIEKLNYFSMKDKKNNKKYRIIISPPFTLLESFSKRCKNKKVKVAAQNCFQKDYFGAYTGFISPFMIKKIGVNNVIIGHSENRSAGETDIILKEKVYNALRNNLNIIFCIGENMREKRAKKTLSVLKKQINIFNKKYNFNKIMIAYEPIWSIGSGKVPDKTELKKTAIAIKNYLKTKFRLSISPKFLYGGSVDGKTINKFKYLSEIDGFLIGGASKSSKKFIDIIKNFYK